MGTLSCPAASGGPSLRKVILASALLVPALARASTPAQFYPQQRCYTPEVVVTPPFVGGGLVAGYKLPFETQ